MFLGELFKKRGEKENMVLMKRLWKNFRNLPIAKKILVWLLLLIILPNLLIEVISYQLSTVTIRNQTGDLIRANMELTATNVQNFFEDYDDIIQRIYTDTTYVANLEPVNLWDSSRYFTAKHTINEKLQDIMYVNKEILGISIVGKNGDLCFYDNISNSSSRSFCFDVQNIRNEELVKTALKQKDTIYSKTYSKNQSEYGDKDYLYIAHQLTDFNNYQKGPVGVLIICVNEDALKKMYHSEDTPYSTTFLINEQGDVISYPERDRIGDNIFDGAEDGVLRKEGIVKNELKDAAIAYIGKIQTIEPKNLEINMKSIVDGQFYMVNVQNIKYALKSANFIAAVIILIGLLTVIVCILVSIYFSEDIDRSVKRILKGMDLANKGDRMARIGVEGQDEFARISNHFNVMMDEIAASEHQEKEALIREKHAEIKSLEAQINPHFLYNTLDTINWVAIEREEYTISKMLTSLAGILRYSIHKSNEVVLIRDELEYLKRYVYLQQQRYEYRFICTVEADESIESCKIHKLLIQPLVENVLVHAFPGSTGADEVNIWIGPVDEQQIQITVKDNGNGMDATLVELFNHLDYRKERIESSIGVRNVITRIKLYYGEKGSFHVESNAHGTCTELRIPYE